MFFIDICIYRRILMNIMRIVCLCGSHQKPCSLGSLAMYVLPICRTQYGYIQWASKHTRNRIERCIYRYVLDIRPCKDVVNLQESFAKNVII